MPDAPSNEELTRWHKWFAIECNNNAWVLVERTGRTAEEDREMLCLAYAATLHWSKVGSALNAMRADLLLTQAHAALKHGDLAVHYGTRAVDFCATNPCEDWDKAFAHAGLALAAATKADHQLHAQHYALAKQLGDAIKDEEDRSIFFASFAQVPQP